MPTGGGFTVIVLSYDRPRALRVLLQGLSTQQLGGADMELIVCNNAAGVRLAASPWTATGRLLRRFPDVKIMNSSHNWLCRVRYPLTTLARHDTIVFIDDDVVITDPHFLRYMYDAFATVRPIDVLSCWTALWTEWNDEHLTKVRMNFSDPAPSEMTECDYAGPGLCIFDRRILIESGRAYFKADGSIRMFAGLGAPWSWMRLLRALPDSLLEPAYELIARNRMRLFGRREVCFAPAPRSKDRFLS